MILQQSSSTPAATPDRRQRVAIAWMALLLAVVYLAWSTLGGASAATRAIASQGVLLPFDAISAALFLLAARAPTASTAMRWALSLLAVAGVAFLTGNLLTGVQIAANGHLALGSVADLCYLAGYPFILAGLLTIPTDQRPGDRWRFICDAGMVLSGAGVALWYFVLRTSVASAANPMAFVLALAYPLSDLLLLVGLVTILLRQPADGNRSAVRWLVMATALMIAADLTFNLTIAHTGARSAFAVDALLLARGVAQITAAERFWRGPITEGESARDPLRLLAESRLRAVLPFVAAGATYVLLLVVALRTWVAPHSGLAIGAIAVSLFLGARQLLAFKRKAAILAEEAVHASEARFRSLVQNSSDVIFQLDANGVITFASSSAERVIGYDPDALIGGRLTALAPPEDAEQVDAFVELAARLPGISPSVEWRLTRPDGELVQVEIVASNLLADPTVRGIVVNARDVGERAALLDQLAHQAFHDPLTGLANRALFYDRVAHALALSSRQDRPVLVLFLDLDDFKQVNDSLGHAEGDRLLTMIAARLRVCARTTDTVARLGGDEFALLVEDVHADEEGARLVERIREQMAYPFNLAGADVQVSTSIGSATAIGGTVDDILRQADVAMYAAKRTEKGTHRPFDPSMLREKNLSEG